MANASVAKLLEACPITGLSRRPRVSCTMCVDANFRRELGGDLRHVADRGAQQQFGTRERQPLGQIWANIFMKFYRPILGDPKGPIGE